MILEIALTALPAAAFGGAYWRLKRSLAERLYRRQVVMDKQQKVLRREVERTRQEAQRTVEASARAVELAKRIEENARLSHRKLDRALDSPTLARVLERDSHG